MDEKIRRLWLDPGHVLGYSGNKARFYAEAKDIIPGLKRKHVDEFFASMNPYTKRARARYKYKRLKTVSYSTFDLVHADLAEVPGLTKHNAGYRYILVVVAVLSKYLWTRPLRTKKTDEVAEQFRDIFKSLPNGEMFTRVQTDAGGEFLAKTGDVFKEYGVFHFQSQWHATVAESFIKKIKHRLWRYMEANGTDTWYKVLPQLTDSFNKSVFPKHGFRPADVDQTNEGIVFRKLYPALSGNLRDTPLRWKFNVGDEVKIALERNKLYHSFYGTYSDTIYRIHARYGTDPVTYAVANRNGGRPLDGRLYEPELISVIS